MGQPSGVGQANGMAQLGSPAHAELGMGRDAVHQAPLDPEALRAAIASAPAVPTNLNVPTWNHWPSNQALMPPSLLQSEQQQLQHLEKQSLPLPPPPPPPPLPSRGIKVLPDCELDLNVEQHSPT